MRLSQGAVSLALGYVLVGLSARLVARGLRDGGMGAGYWACVFSVCRFVMLLPFQGAGLAACVFPRVPYRLPWAMCWLGFQPALWRGVYGMGAWVRAIGRASFLCVVLLCFCPFRAQDWRRASFPGCRFACPGLGAGWAFSPPCGGGGGGGIGAGIGRAKKNPPRPCFAPGGEDCRVGVPVWGRRAYLPIIFSVRVVPSASVTRTNTACGAERDAALYSAVCAPPTRSVPPTCLPSAV